MIYAQIKGGVVLNTIVLDDENLIPVFSANFDAFIDITNLYPQPGICWTYQDTSFSEPPEEESDG